MCGISGIFYYDRQRRVETELLEKMNGVLSHRGPDDAGVWIGGGIGLGHTRLSIIDLSQDGRQPMTNEDGTIWLTFNGEIYNYLELRADLMRRGHRMSSSTDSEVIIHLWEEKGPRLLDDLRGMFAFALWDQHTEILFLARDRLGKKPLFYANLPDRFIFGSEIKAILQDPDFIAEPNLEAIHYYLTYQSVPSPFSAFNGINKLPPAHYLSLHAGRARLHRYWQLSYLDKYPISNDRAQKDLEVEITERLREAVRIRLMSDVPLGAFLSGGIDSSIIVALMAGLIDQPVKTFSIGFAESEYDELAYARLIAQRYHTEHHEFIVTPDAKEIIPDLVWNYNEPFADSSAIPTYYVSNLARQYVTVVLTGDGGDEAFAGYPRYTNQAEYALRAEYPKTLNRIFNPDDSLKPFQTSHRKTLAAAQRLASLNQERFLYYRRITHFHEGYRAHLYSPEFQAQVREKFAVDIMLAKYRQAKANNFLDATLDVDLNLYLPETLMTKTDIASMSNSLEARMPFLDHHFLEFAARIPASLKLKDGTVGKYILKEAFRDAIPPEIINRGKMGFAVPLDHWFRKELKELAYDTLLSDRARQRGLFQFWYVEFMLDRHQAGESWQYLIWNLLMLEIWFCTFIDRP